MLTCALCPSLAVADGRYHLGYFETGETVELKLSEPIPAANLLIELDGQAEMRPTRVAGRSIFVRIPEDLSGRSHDLVVWEASSGNQRLVGTWEFEIGTEGGGVSYALQGQLGVVSDGTRTTKNITGGGRADFESPGGRVSGGIGFTWYNQPDPDTGSRLSLDALHVQTRDALFGDTLTLRLGSTSLETNSALFDNNARRSLIVNLEDLSGHYSVTAFGSQTEISTGPQNITGLSNPDDRIIGGIIRGRPDAGDGLELTAHGFVGRAPETPQSTSPGDVYGLGGSVGFPVGRADVLAQIDQSGYADGTQTRTGQSRRVEANLTLPELANGAAQVLSARYEWIDVDFYAPLNPDLFVGEEGISFTYGVFDPQWDFSITGAVSNTNAGGPPTAPTDRLIEVSADLSYSPDVFTGGFLNGSNFYLGGSMLRQDRVHSPAGSSAPQDHTIWQLAAGVSRFQETNSLSLLYTYDKIDIRSPGAQDQSIHNLVGLASIVLSDQTTISASGTLRNTRSAGSDFWEVEGSGSLAHSIYPGKLDYSAGLGGAWFEDNTKEDYYFVDQSLAWSLSNSYSLVVSADYRKGQSSLRILPGDGWIFGIALRSEFAGLFN